MKKKILIFGASSFIAKNYINYDDYNHLICVTRKNKNDLIKKSNTTYKYIDHLNVNKIKNLVVKNKIGIIINFISNNNNKIDINIDDLKIINDNTFPALQILEAIKNTRIKYVCFDSFEKKKNKKTAYKLSKIILSEIYKYYSSKYKIKIKKINLPTVLGKFDKNKSRLLPYIFKNNKPNYPKSLIRFIFAGNLVRCIKNNINFNKKIKLKIYKKKANFFSMELIKYENQSMTQKNLITKELFQIFKSYKKDD